MLLFCALFRVLHVLYNRHLVFFCQIFGQFLPFFFLKSTKIDKEFYSEILTINDDIRLGEVLESRPVSKLKFDKIALTILMIWITDINDFVGGTHQFFLRNKDIFWQNDSLIDMDACRSQFKGNLTTC